MTIGTILLIVLVLLLVGAVAGVAAQPQLGLCAQRRRRPARRGPADPAPDPAGCRAQCSHGDIGRIASCLQCTTRLLNGGRLVDAVILDIRDVCAHELAHMSRRNCRPSLHCIRCIDCTAREIRPADVLPSR
jgi:hypothetical protein